MKAYFKHANPFMNYGRAHIMRVYRAYLGDRAHAKLINWKWCE